MARSAARAPEPERAVEYFEPVIDEESRRVIERAVRHVNLRVAAVVTAFGPESAVPDRVAVVRLTDAYHGPELLVRTGEETYLLTAPGPDAYLHLWTRTADERGSPTGWERLAEVRVEFAADQPRDDLCPACHAPVRTADHDRGGCSAGPDC